MAVFGFVSSASAAIEYWDTDAASGFQGGAGTWDVGVTALWNTSSSGANPLTTWVNGNDAYFNAGPNAVSISGTITVGTLLHQTSTTTISNGVLRMTNVTANGGSLTIASPVTLAGTSSHRNSFTDYAPITITGNIDEDAGSVETVRVLGNIAGRSVTLGGSNTFTGGIQIYQGASLVLAGPDAAGTGPILFGQTGQSGQTYLLTASLVADGTITNRLIFSGGTGQQMTINSSGAGAATFSGNMQFNVQAGLSGLFGAVGPVALNLGGTSTVASTFSGRIIDSGTGANITSLTKQDAGTWMLTSSNSYTGPTTVSNGVLFISTRHAGDGAFAINDGKTLGVVNQGASESAQMSSLTLGDSSGPTTLVLTNVSDSTTPLIDVSGAVTVNGTASITIPSTNGLSAGTTYPLIKYGSLGGAGFGGFSLSVPSGLTATLTNDTGNAWVALSVAADSSVATNPTNLTFSVTGNALTLGWPSDHVGWVLQSQTNGLSAGISSNWVDVAGSETSSNAVITIDPMNPTVFFRLRSP